MKNLNDKLKKYSMVLCALFAILFIALASITLTQGEKYSNISDNKRLKTLSVSGTRGEITDRNGVVLATNRKSFNVQFARDVSKNKVEDRALYTQSILKAIKVIEENGGKVITGFNLKKDEAGVLYLDFGTISETEIPDETKRNEALAKREATWRQNFYLNEKLTPDEIYNQLRLRYQIPEYADFDTAYKVLSVWQEVQMNAYKSYYPMFIAKNLDLLTVSELETQDFYLDCIQIQEDATRVYPKTNSLANVIGYIGKQNSEEQITKNQEQGYLATDEVGISGIESTMENFLTGSTSYRRGSSQVEVNNVGKIIREVSKTPAKPGNDVVLTIDYDLQRVLEKALEENIKNIRTIQETTLKNNEATYAQKVADRGGASIKMADQGAAVVMDVNSGEVLAMANYPSYDPNLFIGGISAIDYEALSTDKSLPLYNKAISGGTPGSVFKMITASAGLMEGNVGLNETISDNGRYIGHLNNPSQATINAAPKCWTNEPTTHAHQDVIKAVKNSCNYYFYEIANRMGIEKINKWSDSFGLTSKTNIELPGEAKGKVGNQQVLYDRTKDSSNQVLGTPRLVKNQVVKLIKDVMTADNIAATDEEIDTTAETILKLVEPNKLDIGEAVRGLLSEKLKISPSLSRSSSLDRNIMNALNEIRWKPIDTITTGTGQGITTVTPVGVARYVSALVNGGKVFDARLIKATVNSQTNEYTSKESTVFNTVDMQKEYLNSIKQGMRDVVSHEDGGTAGMYFTDWTQERRDMLGGKTGTGQISKIDIENNAWFVGFAPFEKPEIAVVVFVPSGMSGGYTSYTVKQIVEKYLDDKEAGIR